MKSKIIRLPFGAGRLLLAHELRGAAVRAGGLVFGTNLRADFFRKGRWEGSQDLGSGLVTNVGVLALANDFGWSATNALNSLFAKMKYHASGTGVTAAAATDIKLQTASANGGQTPVAGTQVLGSAANLQKYQSLATISYTGAEAADAWGVFSYWRPPPAGSAPTRVTTSASTA